MQAEHKAAAALPAQEIEQLKTEVSLLRVELQTSQEHARQRDEELRGFEEQHAELHGKVYRRKLYRP